MTQNLVFFNGCDAAGDYGLWVADGTVPGTQELIGINGAYQGSGGINPNNITVFNDEVAFSGTDAAGNAGLWVSNGTAAGTQELTGINGAYTGAGGLEPSDLTVFNSALLIIGVVASGNKGLGLTNGRAAGTQELTGISGTYKGSGGLDPSDLTVFNGEILFSGTDAAGNVGLWVTDGTAAGTHELTGISGAYAGGILSSTFALPLSSDLTVFGSEVLFEGADTAGNYGLWVTNGTAAGTQELTGIAGASSHGIFSFVFSPDFTVFNSVVTISWDGSSADGTTFNESQVLFDGTDAAGNDNLWVPDGTAAGTYELTGISGANPFGLFYAVEYPDFKVFAGEVLFDATDAAGNNGLWVTNGTPGGTHELTGINGASADGIFSSVANPNFTVINGKVLFVGTDAAGHNGLWVTDGTAGGTHELTGISGASDGAFGLNPSDLTFKGVEINFQNVNLEHVLHLERNHTIASGRSRSGPLTVSDGSHTANNGGMLTVSTSGGTDSGATVGTGSTLNVLSSGTDSGTSVTGGTMNVSSGGMADATSVSSGGTMNVSSGGTASGVSLGSGGTLNVSSGGVVNALRTDDKNDPNITAVANVQSGGTVDGSTKIDGGQLILDAGAVFEPHAKLTIINTGELVLEQNTFKGTIQDFGGQDFMDLTKIKFIGQGPDATPATFTQTNGAGGQLQVAHGSHIADLHLAGTYATANFALQSDGVHGTTVTFIPNASLVGHG